MWRHFSASYSSHQLYWPNKLKLLDPPSCVSCCSLIWIFVFAFTALPTVPACTTWHYEVLEIETWCGSVVQSSSVSQKVFGFRDLPLHTPYICLGEPYPSIIWILIWIWIVVWNPVLCISSFCSVQHAFQAWLNWGTCVGFREIM